MKNIYQWTSDDGLYAEFSLNPTNFNDKESDSVDNLGDLSGLDNDDLYHLISIIEHGCVKIYGGSEAKNYILKHAKNRLDKLI